MGVFCNASSDWLIQSRIGKYQPYCKLQSLEKMEDSEKFCLRWNDFEKNISGAFQELRDDKDFFDVTLACDDDQLQAHKVILSACSPFFRSILRRNKHEHPLLFLKGVRYIDLLSVLNFMYHGEVNVAQEELNSFLSVAEDLKVKGLTQNNSEKEIRKPSAASQPNRTQTRVTPLQASQERVPKQKLSAQTPEIQSQNSRSNIRQETDIQEIVPIKTEPSSYTHDQNSRPHLPTEVEQPYATLGEEDVSSKVVADPNSEYVDEYGDYEGYDDAYDNYSSGGGTHIMDSDGNTELDQLIANALTRDAVSGEWMCKYCSKTNKDKARITRHAETHFPGFSQQCPYCEKVTGSRNSLRAHVSRAHTSLQSKQRVF